jgi:hypothetical protein
MRLALFGMHTKGNGSMITALTQFKQEEGLSCHISDKHIAHLDGGVKIKLVSAWVRNARC